MGVLVKFLTLATLITLSHAGCPEDDKNLVKWSDHKNTWNDSPPGKDDNVVITQSILLDEQPPTLWSITIQSGGKLVWDPNTEVHLKVHWIQVDGELHIGSEDCPFEQNTRIVFLGDVEENDLGAGGDKALFVTDGGVLEIHGKPKLSWTKLTQTAGKLSEDSIYVDLKNIDNKREDGKGLVVYSINPKTGSLDNKAYFNLNSKKGLSNRILNFVTFLNDIPTGNIVGVAVKTELVRRGNVDGALEAIEILAGHEVGAGPLRDTKGAAYAMITMKGHPELTTEMHKPWTYDKKTAAEVDALFGDLHVAISSVYFRKRLGACYAHAFVVNDQAYRPTINLLNNVTTWEAGDKLIMASTDYDWKQAEEVEVIKCDSCSDYQVRLSAPLKYTHYGEIYKNVDMRGEVGLLSRNILFESEDAKGTDTYGGNLKVLKGFKSVHIEHAEFNDMGQQEVLGRYPIHFHMCEDVDGDEATRPWIKHNSIHHSNSRCVTIHGTHGLIVEDNVCYITLGHAYFLEDGGEKRTILDGNLGLGTQRGSLILADSRPATFWITNPISYVRNNAAAGGDGRGYWYTYPSVPLGPSADKNFMAKDEARYTAVYEFDNNVAHSYSNHGIFVDNIFHTNTAATGYNKYHPVEDPLMHLKYKNSTNKAAIFNRLTAYKNSPRNAWLRGGELKVTRASLSDSPTSITIVKENQALQFLEQSVIIGDSPNKGEVAMVNNKPVSIGRSFPMSMRTNWRAGYRLRKGPIYMTDVFFDDFADNEYYNMGAIGFEKQFKQSPFHSAVNMKFGFSDPSEGNRVQKPPKDETVDQKDDNRSFRDTDYSVTGVNAGGKTITVITPEPMLLTDKCSERKNWNFAYCEHRYTKIRVNFGGVDNNLLTMTRDDDYEISRMDADDNKGANFLVITGDDAYSYSMYWEDEVPNSFQIQAIGVTLSEGVRVAVCLPPGADFVLTGVYPTKYKFSSWTNVTSVSEVDDIAEYFFDPDTGYLSLYLTNDKDFDENELGSCPEGVCTKINVHILSGDRTDSDCLDAVHQKFDIANKMPEDRRRIRQLIDLLRRRLDKNRQESRGFLGNRHRRSAYTTKYDERELPATASEPEANWGAGATKS